MFSNFLLKQEGNGNNLYKEVFILFKLNKIEEKVILLTVIIILGIAFVYKMVVYKESSVKVVKHNEEENRKESDGRLGLEPETICVYITGEVNNPGIYEMKKGSRIKDVVDSAGGFTDNADKVSVNLSEKVSDEQHIDILKKYDEKGAVEKGSIKGDKININTATAKELDDFLPGVGPTIANNIVNYREKNGRYKKIEEITNVERIGNGKTFERIKELITVN